MYESKKKVAKVRRTLRKGLYPNGKGRATFTKPSTPYNGRGLNWP